MATWNSGKSNRRQPTGRVGAMASIGSVAAGCVVLGLTVWVAPSRMAAQGMGVQPISYSSTGGAMIDAYIARPAGAAKSPAVIVVHDDLGANKAIQDLTQRFAQAGFVALAPHLPSRSKTPALDFKDGRPPQPTPVAALGWSQTVDDVRAAFTFLQQDSAVDASRISAVGIGWGEFRVWKLAEQTPTLHRAVVFYGLTPTDDDSLRTVRTPILGHYAEQDYLITMRVLKTKKLLGDRFTYHIYPTAPGFFGGGTGQLQQATGGYVISLRGGATQAAAAAAKQAWTRTVEFLQGSAAKGK